MCLDHLLFLSSPLSHSSFRFSILSLCFNPYLSYVRQYLPQRLSPFSRLPWPRHIYRTNVEAFHTVVNIPTGALGYAFHDVREREREKA